MLLFVMFGYATYRSNFHGSASIQLLADTFHEVLLSNAHDLLSYLKQHIAI